MGIWSKLFGSGKAGAASRESFGYSPEDPILCYQPAGERAFLESIVCPNGHPFNYHRQGSFQGSCPDQKSHVAAIPTPLPMCIVDKYELLCTGGEHRCELYFDMNHPNAPKQPAPHGLKKK